MLKYIKYTTIYIVKRDKIQYDTTAYKDKSYSKIKNAINIKKHCTDLSLSKNPQYIKDEPY